MAFRRGFRGSGGRRRFSRSVTWRKKSWVGSSVVDTTPFTETGIPGLYQSDVLFVPLVQVVDYSTWPLEELGGPVIPQGTAQERIKLIRCKLDAEFIFLPASSGFPNYWTCLMGWYLAKFSLSEIQNAIAVGPAGTFSYDPMADTAEHLFKHPVVRFGQDSWTATPPTVDPVSGEFVQSNLPTRHISFSAPMRLSMETDEEFYLVISASATGEEEVTPVTGLLTLQARTQFVT